MEQIQFLTGDADTLNELYRQKPYIPFAQQTIVFLDAFYQTLRKENQSLQAADIAALAFWCREKVAGNDSIGQGNQFSYCAVEYSGAVCI